jgi:hypothetical protein
MDMIGYLMGDNGTCDWLPWKMAQFVRWITWYILVYLHILVIFHGYVRLPVGMSGYASLGYNLGCRKWDEIRIPWRFYRDTMEVWHDITVLYGVVFGPIWREDKLGIQMIHFIGIWYSGRL